jgi:aspartokinase/homoserine dehydrogenase 1
MLVMKFGGTSVADAARIDEVARLIAAADEPVAAVVSAMSGVTDTLLQLGRAAASGHEVQATLAALRARHQSCPVDAIGAAALARDLDELERLLQGVALLRELTPRSIALLASFGERLSASIAASSLRALGRHAEAIDARRFVVTDARHESASVDLEATRARADKVIRPLLSRGVTPIITGFIGATPDGTTTLLGRGGSDWSGAIVGAVLDAREIWIWTDVDGILTADPRIVKEARRLDRVSYREAAEMSYFGAKVVHPKTMMPAQRQGIPIRIRSTFEPDKPGTVIDIDAPTLPQGVKTVTAIRALALVTIEGNGLSGVPGSARRIFHAAEQSGANVIMISQASSEQTVSLVVREDEVGALDAALKSSFDLEIRAGLVSAPRIQTGMAAVSIIGEGMAGTPGVSARFFGALGAARVNVAAIAQGASELSISVAVRESDAVRAVQVAHTAFGLTRVVHVALLGVGRVAGSLLRMIDETRTELAAQHGISLAIIGAATRSKAFTSDAAVPPTDVQARLDAAGPRPTDDAWLAALRGRATDLVLVDLSGSDTSDLHVAALQGGFHVVTANKIPLAGPRHADIARAAREAGVRYGFETTVGAGLPVVGTLRDLVHTGDRILSVEGCFSGTLGFVATRLQDGAPLADVIADAQARGYTEPDPRDDLSGKDVARKAMILARAMGWKVEDHDLTLTPFVPGLERGLDAAIEVEGPQMAAACADAAARGATLRYVARLEDGRVQVGLREVPVDSPIGSLRGPDNLLVFRTSRYRDNPLVVRGPGAGADVTAAGVLGDILRIAGL